MKASNVLFISEASASAQGMTYHWCSIGFASASDSINERNIPMSPSAPCNHTEKAVHPLSSGMEEGSWASLDRTTVQQDQRGPIWWPCPRVYVHHDSQQYMSFAWATLPGLQGAQVCSQLSQALLRGDRLFWVGSLNSGSIVLILRWSAFCSISGPRLFLRPFLWVFRFI